MEIEPSYTFLPLGQKHYAGYNEKKTQDYLCKWGLKGNIIIQDFSFNEPFQLYHKYHLVNAFFKNKAVAQALLSKETTRWMEQAILASTVDVKHIACSVLNMSFFDKLRDPENGIVFSSGTIRKTYDKQIGDFLISDHLRELLLDEDSSLYTLYNEEDRKEFIFCLFQMLVLGGALCQYEDTLEPYLELTKSIYKDLIRVRRQSSSDHLAVNTTVFKVVAKDAQGRPYFPMNPDNLQNVAFLLLDGQTREITTVLHQFGRYCVS